MLTGRTGSVFPEQGMADQGQNQASVLGMLGRTTPLGSECGVGVEDEVRDPGRDQIQHSPACQVKGTLEHCLAGSEDQIT